MDYRDLNNKGLYAMRMNNFMQSGGQPEEPVQGESPIDELIPVIKSAIDQGVALPQLILSLAQNQVPMPAIQEALMAAGIAQEEIAQAFQALEQEQAQAQAEVQQMESPVESAEPMQEAAMDPNEGMEQMPMAQDGEEIKNQGGYDYKKVVNPETGEATYFTKKEGAKNWRDLQDPKNTRALKAVRADIFGDKVEEWQGTPEEAQWDAQMGQMYREGQAKKKAKRWVDTLPEEEKELTNSELREKLKRNAPSINDILKGGYKTKVINYPYGYKDMPPGHIESVLIDSEGNPVPFYVDAEGKVQDAFVNRWEQAGNEFLKIAGYDEGSDDNVDEGHLLSLEALGKRLESDPYIRSMDLDLTPDEIKRFLGSTKGEVARDYNLFTDNCAQGVCRAYGVDPGSVGQSIVGMKPALRALIPGVPESLMGDQTLTDPMMVFETLRKNYGNRASNFTGKQKGREQGLKDMLGVEPGSWGDRAISVGADVYRGARELNRMYEEDFQPSKIIDEGVGPALKSVWDYWTQEEGGETGKYSNIINKAQYGLGIGNYMNLNQFYNQPDYRPNIRSAYKPMNLGLKGDTIKALGTVAEGVGRLFSKKDTDGDGLMDGAFRDMKAKRARHKAQKAMSYDYDINIDPNDPNKYAASAVDLFEASKRKNKGALRNADDALTEMSESTMLKYNPETMAYDVKMNMPEKYMSKNKDLRPDFTGYKSFSELQSTMSGLSEDQKSQLKYMGETMGDFQSQKKEGNLPEGMQLGMDERGALGYYPEGTTIPEGSQENINKMMMGDYKKGGAYDNPGFKALPEFVQAKIMKGQEGMEMRPGRYNSILSSRPDYSNPYMDMAQSGQEMAPSQQPSQEGQLMQQVAQALQQGAEPQKVVEQLMQMGMAQEQAIQIIQAVVQQLQGAQQPQMSYGGSTRKLKRASTGMEMMAPDPFVYEQGMITDQMMRQVQRRQQLDNLMNEVKTNSPQKTYRKKSPQDAGTVELTTEQIAKIMAAGGSVKIV